MGGKKKRDANCPEPFAKKRHWWKKRWGTTMGQIAGRQEDPVGVGALDYQKTDYFGGKLHRGN